jgi:hypothetical protein
MRSLQRPWTLLSELGVKAKEARATPSGRWRTSSFEQPEDSAQLHSDERCTRLAYGPGAPQERSGSAGQDGATAGLKLHL